MAKRLDRLAGREDARERFGAGAKRPMGGVRCIEGAHGVHCPGGGRGDGQEAVEPRSRRVFSEREGTA